MQWAKPLFHRIRNHRMAGMNIRCVRGAMNRACSFERRQRVNLRVAAFEELRVLLRLAVHLR
ncbi:MAG: hypothetical protein ACLP1W_01455, partial [Rhodomicrobium sp.]